MFLGHSQEDHVAEFQGLPRSNSPSGQSSHRWKRRGCAGTNYAANGFLYVVIRSLVSYQTTASQ